MTMSYSISENVFLWVVFYAYYTGGISTKVHKGISQDREGLLIIYDKWDVRFCC